jgi:hypothetical protein
MRDRLAIDCANSLRDPCAWILAIAIYAFAASVAVAEPAGESPRLLIQPSRIELHEIGRRHGVLVTAIDASGSTHDVTFEADLRIEDEAIAALEWRQTLVAKANGSTRLIARFDGHEAECEIVVAVDAREAASVSFRHEVMPLLTRLGCNAGECHGKLAGQNGFRLSLRGYAPKRDHEWLTREFEGRRVNRPFPAESLLIQKPAGKLPHRGGKLFAEGSREHRTLVDWIASGAPGLNDEEAVVERIEVLPGNRTLAAGDAQQLLVLAHFRDGRVRDVAWLCRFFSGNEDVVCVSPEGSVACLAPGETVVRVHFQEHVEIVTCTAPFPHDVTPRTDLAVRNEIDKHVFAKLAALRIPTSGPCSEQTFVRRVYIDAIGRLPTAEEVQKFRDDPRMDKRSRLIDDLLERPEFVDYWTLLLADLLQNRKERDHDVRGVKGVRAMHYWLRRQIAANRPWNEIARDVLTAKGDSFSTPQIGYYIVTIGEKRQAEESEVADSVAEAFLGTRIGCAKCHNHPLEKYTQDDYYRFAGFFDHVAFVRRKPEEGPTELYVAGPQRAELRRRIVQLETKLAKAEEPGAEPPADEKPQQQLERQRQQLEQARSELATLQDKPPQVRQPRTGELLAPRPLDRSEVEIAAGEDPRQALVDWMTAPANEYFSGNMVNRLWKHFLKVGLVEPVDDLRPSNPPSNRPLWDFLNREFVASGYDLKHVMRLILNSQVYQLSSDTLEENAAEQRFYSHYYARRIQAEVLADAISDVTGVPDAFPGYPLGLRAVQIPTQDGDHYFLSVFGRPERTTSCACERSDDVPPASTLHLLNSDWMTRKLFDGEGWLKRTLAEVDEDRQMIDAIFLRAVARLPTSDELERINEHLAKTPNREEAFADLLWAIVNSREFIFNH